MSHPNAPRTDGRMRVSLDPETAGPTPTLERVQVRRVDARHVAVLVRFATAMPQGTGVTLNFGQLQAHARGKRGLSMHLEDSGLWRSKWSHVHMEHAWGNQGADLQVRLRLPSPYEQVPQLEPFEASTFTEAPWTIMTRRQWLDAVDRQR